MIPRTANHSPNSPEKTNKQTEEKIEIPDCCFKGSDQHRTKKGKALFPLRSDQDLTFFWVSAVNRAEGQRRETFPARRRGRRDARRWKADARSAADIPRRKILGEMCRGTVEKNTVPERSELLWWCCLLARNRGGSVSFPPKNIPDARQR